MLDFASVTHLWKQFNQCSFFHLTVHFIFCFVAFLKVCGCKLDSKGQKVNCDLFINLFGKQYELLIMSNINIEGKLQNTGITILIPYSLPLRITAKFNRIHNSNFVLQVKFQKRHEKQWLCLY